MTLATGAYHGLTYVAESTFGTTPSTPQMVSLRHKSCTLGLSRDSKQSEELRSDRQISDMRLQEFKVSGQVGFELSYGEYDPFLEAALMGSWTSNVLKAGLAKKSFTMERAFADIGKYAVFSGCMVDKFALDVKTGEMVTGTLDFVGKTPSPLSGTTLDASPTASLTNSPLDGFSGTVKEGGSTIAVVTGVSLSLANSLDAAFVLGSKYAHSIDAGRSNLTGTLSAFFEDEVLLNKFINETGSSIEFTLGSGAAKSYTFLIPNVKYTGGGDVNVSGEGRIALSMPFQALYDATTGTNIQITRIPGA